MLKNSAYTGIYTVSTFGYVLISSNAKRPFSVTSAVFPSGDLGSQADLKEAPFLGKKFLVMRFDMGFIE